MKAFLKSVLLSSTLGRRAYGIAQENWFDWTYRRRREAYERAVGTDPRAWQVSAAIARCRERLAGRGYSVRSRPLGDIHTFAYVPSNWPHQSQIAAALTGLGPCTRFDYCDLGVRITDLRTSSAGHRQRRKVVQKAMFAALRAAHRRRHVDWFFSYSVGWDISAEMLLRIREELGIPTVNISLDDKNWWEEIERGDPEGGLLNVAPHFDLGWTSARVVTPWYWAEGGQALFLPEGVNVETFRPLEVTRDIPVGFVGNNFGYRPEMLATLRRAGIEVAVYGTNWPSGPLSDPEMLLFFNRCRVNLGLGDMHYSRWLTNLKGRDFEIPATGRASYLTSYNSDLARCFTIGTEIDCYRGPDEMIELIRYHLREPEHAVQMAKRGRDRCIASHQWVHRFHTILRALGILPGAQDDPWLSDCALGSRMPMVHGTRLNTASA